MNPMNLLNWMFRGSSRAQKSQQIAASSELSYSDMTPAPAPLLVVSRVFEDAQIPKRQSAASSGLDLFAYIPEGLRTLRVGERAKISTGVRVEIPEGYEGQVRPRSGLADKHGIGVVNSPGTIDQDYRGELQVLLINLGDKDFVLAHGLRMAQLVICPVILCRVAEAEGALSETERGEGGFGSTGVR